MRLEKYQVTTMLARFRAVASFEEVIETCFKKIGGTGVAGNVSTQFTVGLIRAYDHGQSIPAHDRGEALFNGKVARKHRLLIN